MEGLQSLATTLSNTGSLQNKNVDISGLTVPPIITGRQNAMTELTKAIDAQQQQLTAAVTKFDQDVLANMAAIMIASPREMNDVRTADSAALRSRQGFFVN